MTSITATDAKQSFGRLLDLTRSGPVAVERHGRRVAVVLSPEEFDRLRRLAVGTKGQRSLRSASAKGAE